jgi:hypothetical protein
METLTSKLEHFVQGKLMLTNREALNLIRNYRIAIAQESEARQKKAKVREQELERLMEELVRG